MLQQMHLKKLYVIGFALRALYKHRTAYTLFDEKPQFLYPNLFLFLAQLFPSFLSSVHILLFVKKTLPIVKFVFGLLSENS